MAALCTTPLVTVLVTSFPPIVSAMVIGPGATLDHEEAGINVLVPSPLVTVLLTFFRLLVPVMGTGISVLPS
jgi:hypothetical protein